MLTQRGDKMNYIRLDMVVSRASRVCGYANNFLCDRAQ